MSDRREELSKHNFFDELMELGEKQRSRSKGLFVVKGSDIPVENNRHGLMQWYMHPNLTDVSLNTKLFYVQHVPPGSKSGRQHHPGGKIFNFWKARATPSSTVSGIPGLQANYCNCRFGAKAYLSALQRQRRRGGIDPRRRGQLRGFTGSR